MRRMSVSNVDPDSRELVRCPNCDGSSYRVGTYDQHVRESTHPSHTRDKAFMVDLAGKVHPGVRAGD